jgi:sulfatase maturation enzyme AslB (radical SAM superfamily)
MSPHIGDITVFFLTVGASSAPAALRALKEQGDDINIVPIEYVAPMSAAFQEMLDRCRTRWFVQVDEDMVLKPGAVGRLLQSIVDADGRGISHVVHPLWDDHLDRAILGVKVYDHGIVSKYPYRNVQSCEMDQINRMRADGFDIEITRTDLDTIGREDQDVLGFHGTSYTPREAFERYRDLTQKWLHTGGNDWFGVWPQRFLRRFIDESTSGSKLDVSNVDLWSFLGSVVGMAMECPEGEKDFRTYGGMVDYARIAVALVDKGPMRLDLHATPFCNLKCQFCRRQLGDGVDPYHFTPQMARRVLECFPTLTSACVAGFGEPLLVPELEVTMSILLDAGLYVSLITNGVDVESRYQAIPWGRLGYINVSMNAVDADRHAVVTGCPGAFGRIVEGFDHLISDGHNAGMSFVVDQESWREIPKYLEFASERGARFVSLVNILPHHNTNDEAQNEVFWTKVLTVDNLEYAEAVPGLQQLARSLGLDVNAWPVPIDRSCCPRRCRSPFDAIGVGGSGHLSGCNRVDAPGAKYGGIGSGPSVWKTSGGLRGLRRALSGDGSLPNRCTMCFGNWL